jgi:hypothetical protein
MHAFPLNPNLKKIIRVKIVFQKCTFLFEIFGSIAKRAIFASQCSFALIFTGGTVRVIGRGKGMAVIVT